MVGFGLLGHRVEDETVRRQYGDQRQNEHQNDGQRAVHLFLPIGAVRSVSNALIERLSERTTNQPEYEQLLQPYNHTIIYVMQCNVT